MLHKRIWSWKHALRGVALGIIVRIINVWFWDCMTNSWHTINHMASNRTFREPKSAVEEREILENAVPRSTRSVNKWAMKIFGEWQAGRTNKKACEEESGSAVETSQIQDLETNICDMTAESLNFWLVYWTVKLGIEKLNCIKVVLFVIPVYSAGHYTISFFGSCFIKRHLY